MFESLSDRFEGIFTRLRSRGRLGEKDVDEVLREIRVALLEADVNFRVARGFVARVKERCVGADLSKSLTPAQQGVKIVHGGLVTTRGGQAGPLVQAAGPASLARGRGSATPRRRRTVAGARLADRRPGI